MHTGTGIITEIYLDGTARLDCPPNLIPSPGQYLHAHSSASDSPLPVPLFFYDSAPNGFRFAPPLPSSWTIGTRLNLRGPLGHGFVYPVTARKVALVAFDDSAFRLYGLMSHALKENAEVVLVSDSSVGDLSEAIEIQPLQAFIEVCKWADFVAMDLARENLSQLRERLGLLNQVAAVREAQVLIHTDFPCGGLAECGVCAVNHRDGWKMACKDGPVFILKDLFS